jgi:uncharacterized membrane protein (TIGR02234 family)
VRSGRRGLALCSLALVLAAALLWVSSALVWYRVTAQVPLRGPVPVAFTGAQVWAPVLGLAPLALAGVAALLALAGPLRRGFGVLVALLGGWAVVASVRAVVGPHRGVQDQEYPTPPPGVGIDALRDQPLVATAAPWAALAAGLAMAAVGIWVSLRERDLPRFGARFSTGRDRPREPDQDRAWWDALDGGSDPTAADEGANGTTNGTGADPRAQG